MLPRFQLGRIAMFLVLSISLSGLSAQTPLYVSHWDTNSDPSLTSGSAGAVTTSTVDTICSQITMQVADTANAPLPAFSAYIINPKDAMGNDIADLSGNMRIYFRAKSREDVELSVLLRSGGGTSAERTDRVAFVVPGDTSNWSEYEFEFTPANLAGFDSTDLRDLWFYLDRGTSNFAGNEFVIDYVSVGAAPDSATWSTCGTSNPPMPVEGPIYTTHWSAATDSIFTGSAAASLTQTIDEVCSQLKLEVTDPTTTPLSAFSPIIMVPRDSMGNNIVDLSGKLSIHLRARSKSEVSLGLILRSGDGTSAFRTDLQEQIIPADTINWTEVTFLVDTSVLGGFDSTDLRDVWFFLDRGTDNFAGNEFYLDYLSIGEAPDPSANSSCSFLPPVEFPYVVHWADTADRVLSGTGAVHLTQTIETACSQLAVSVIDPVGDPLPAFRPLIINPADQFGNDITDLSGQMTFTVRIRSAGELLVGMLLRAGDGTMPFRTETIEKTVPGDLTKWTELQYTFAGADYGGFDSTDLRDLWLYFDRESPNFNGNEVYLDFVSIGARPDTAQESDCVQSVGINDDLAISALNLYPNPSAENQSVQVDFLSETVASYRIEVYSMMGNLVRKVETGAVVGEQSVTIDGNELPSGMYMVQVTGANKKSSLPWIIQ